MSKSPEKKTETTLSADSSVDHHDWIAQMAYYLAEKRGFAPGGELDDWHKAEVLRAGEA
jgi:hypothetical protein